MNNLKTITFIPLYMMQVIISNLNQYQLNILFTSNFTSIPNANNSKEPADAF